jgi:hydrogenase maturation factor
MPTVYAGGETIEILDAIRRALGIERPISSATIKADVESIVMVEVGFPMERSEDAKVAEVLRKYRLVAFPEPDPRKVM